MGHAEPTRASLLLRVRDAKDRRAWEEFTEIYEPLVRKYCRKRGLQEADAGAVCTAKSRVLARIRERILEVGDE